MFDLYKLGLPVIPVVGDVSDLDELGYSEKYIVKPLDGADSLGMEILNKNDLIAENPINKIIQPYVEFDYEVSFYYLDSNFQYALYAPDKTKRWDLTEYTIRDGDLAFANTFIKWNNINTGITRVDACRLKDGSLLLVELEDLNPFLSIDVLSKDKKDAFINNWVEVLKELTKKP